MVEVSNEAGVDGRDSSIDDIITIAQDAKSRGVKVGVGEHCGKQGNIVHHGVKDRSADTPRWVAALHGVPMVPEDMLGKIDGLDILLDGARRDGGWELNDLSQFFTN